MGAPQKKECRKTRAGPYGTESGKKSDKRFRCTASSRTVKSARRFCDSGPKKNAAFRSEGGADGNGFFPPYVLFPSGAGGISAARSRLFADGISPSL
jgi:hypothetical protein